MLKPEVIYYMKVFVIDLYALQESADGFINILTFFMSDVPGFAKKRYLRFMV